MARKHSDPEKAKKPFPTALRKIMEAQNITQTTLAKHLDKSAQAVSLYCTGESAPDLETLVKIAAFLNTSTDYLLGLEPDPTKKPSAAAEIGLSIENIAFLKDPQLPTGRRFRKEDVYGLVNDLLDICREKHLYGKFQLMKSMLYKDINPVMARDPGYSGISPLAFDEYIQENRLFVLPRIDAADYYSSKIGALIGHSLMEKYCMPQREAAVIPTDRNESGDEDGND